MIACYSEHTEIVAMLLGAGADVGAKDCFGKMAIERTKNHEILEILKHVIEL